MSCKYVFTYTQIYSYHWCHDLIFREIKIGKIHIVASLIFVTHVSLGREIDVCVEQDFRWTEVKGMEPYALLSDALFIFIELLLNVCTTVIKLFIVLVCIITTCINFPLRFLLCL